MNFTLFLNIKESALSVKYINEPFPIAFTTKANLRYEIISSSFFLFFTLYRWYCTFYVFLSI